MMKYNDLEISRLIDRLEKLGIVVTDIKSSGFGNMLNFEMTYQLPNNKESLIINFRRFDIQDIYLHFKNTINQKSNSNL